MQYIMNNECKKAFHQAFKPELDKHKHRFKDCKLRFIYTISSANKRKFDISNVLSIVDKFACDSLVKEGFLPDDNWEHLVSVTYKFAGVTGCRVCTLQIEEY